MKVLFIAPLPPPVTGHSLAAKVLLDELLKLHQVEVINLSKEGFSNGVDSLGRISQVLRILGETWRKRKNQDLIYLTISESVAGNIKDLIIYLICFGSLSKMVVHLHGGSIKKLLFDKNRLLFRINRYFIKRLGAAIVLGPSHVEIFSELIGKEEIHIVSNFAEDNLFVDREQIIDKFSEIAPLRILFLSNLIEGKGHNELVDAYLALDAGLKERVRIDFAGGFESVPQESIFLSRIERIAGIEYHGIVSGDKKRSLLSNAHIFCLPTILNEGQPIGILEAYASGCVVLTTGQDGIRDVFRDEVNGFELRSGSADSIKFGIEQILGKTECLLPLAISNRETAHEKYRTSNYNASLMRIMRLVATES